jgi:hypothetical protein
VMVELWMQGIERGCINARGIELEATTSSVLTEERARKWLPWRWGASASPLLLSRPVAVVCLSGRGRINRGPRAPPLLQLRARASRGRLLDCPGASSAEPRPWLVGCELQGAELGGSGQWRGTPPPPRGNDFCCPRAGIEGH